MFHIKKITWLNHVQFLYKASSDWSGVSVWSIWFGSAKFRFFESWVAFKCRRRHLWKFSFTFKEGAKSFNTHESRLLIQKRLQKVVDQTNSTKKPEKLCKNVANLSSYIKNIPNSHKAFNQTFPFSFFLHTNAPLSSKTLPVQETSIQTQTISIELISVFVLQLH